MNGARGCPVCGEIGEPKLTEASGVVFAALQAYLDRDFDTLSAIQSTAQPEDFHAAMGVMTFLLSVMSAYMGLDIQQWVKRNRDNINAALAKA